LQFPGLDSKFQEVTEEAKNQLLAVRVDPEARKILERVACKVVYHEDDRLPLGKIITAMILWFEDNVEWEEIEEAVRADWDREVAERKRRDRKRKRDEKAKRITPS
jgi:hypothetical protein